MINTGTFEVWHHGKMIKQAYVRDFMNIGVCPSPYRLGAVRCADVTVPRAVVPIGGQ
jgi:hypothetical protein